MRLPSIKNLSLLLFGSFGGAGLAFLTQVFLARLLNAEFFGVYGAAIALAMLMTPIASFGIGPFWLKVFGEEGWSGLRWIRPSVSLVTLGTAVGMLIMVLWGAFGPNSSESRVLLVLLSFHIAGQVAIELVSSKLQLEERYANLAIWQFFPHFLRFILIVILAILFEGSLTPELIGLVYSGTAILIVIMAVLSIKKMSMKDFCLKGHAHVSNSNSLSISQGKVIRNAWPFGMAMLAYLIYFQSDIVLLKYLEGDTAAGLYNAAFAVMAAVYLFPSVIFQKFLLPKIHRWAHHDRNKLHKVYIRGSRSILVIGILVAVVLWAMSSLIINVLFGESYSKASEFIEILSISVPAMFVSFCSGAMLVTKEHMKIKIYFMLVVAIFNLTANLVFIPVYGAVAAAITTVASQYLLAVLYQFGVSRLVFKNGIS
tara:strand:- start:5646 stop:6926 length:1281 start_codon:yes stop_codon:yes gene_type:complete